MNLTIIKNRIFKLFLPLLSSIVFFYFLTQIEANGEEKNTKITIEQIKIKQMASEKILKKIAQNEIEKSWINASIISIEKIDNSKWIVMFKNNEPKSKEKKLNILIDNTKVI